MKAKTNDLTSRTHNYDGSNSFFHHKELGHTIDRLDTLKKTFAAFYIDFDNLKLLNENYGYALGDQFLLAGFKVLKQIIENNDGIGFRVGGDEILVLKELKHVFESNVMLNEFMAVSGRGYNASGCSTSLSFCIGLAVNRLKPLRETVVCSKSAMMDSKEAGKNRATVYLY